MPPSVKPIPEGYHSVTPYLVLVGAAQAIEFYKTCFGAVESVRMPGPDGRVAHAEIKIGDSVVMLADENPSTPWRGPKAVGGSPVSLVLYVEDVDKTVNGAVAAGARIVRPVEDQFYGDRTGGIEDPFGHQWHIATHIEDVTPDEMRRRMAAMAPPK